MSLRVISLNVRGLSEEKKRRIIFNHYRGRADILCLLETHSEFSNEIRWRNEWGGDAIFSHSTAEARGICVLFRKGANIQIEKIAKDNEGRIIACECKKNQFLFTLCAVYAPNEERPQFFVESMRMFSEMSENRIWIGDFNLVFDPEIDRLGSYYNKHRAKEILTSIKDELMLEDVWRILNEGVKTFSWMKRVRNKLLASRIDFALISRSMVQRVEQILYLPGVRTDHSAVYLCVKTDVHSRGKGYWKMNVSLFRDQSFVEEINELLEDLKKQMLDSPIQERWEWIKYQIVKKSKVLSKKRASDLELIISQLSEKIFDMENSDIEKMCEQEVEIMFNTKNDLDNLLEEKARGIMFRSKAMYQEMGEKSTKYFLNMEKERYNAKTCTTLNINGIEVSDPKEIIKEQRKFYQELYKSERGICFNLKNEENIRITKEQKETLGMELSQQEIAKAVFG